jgi:transposase InsO family protein
MKQIDPLALFRLSVLGPLASREQLGRGEVQTILQDLAGREYAIPGTTRRHIRFKTLQAWYYAWRRQGIEGLVPQPRADRGRSRMSAALQEAVLAAKRDNPRRSVRQIVRLLQAAGTAGAAGLSRSAVHRLLLQHGLSRLGPLAQPEEKRSFSAQYAGSIWYGDVMHGPSVPHQGRLRKTYLVSLIDDASRLVAHSAFCLGETALDIQGVLKQALLRRGVPLKLVVDNGAAYRCTTLQGICARLGIQLVYCRPYAPEGKGKLERWHRTLRAQFLGELQPQHITGLDDLNARLWAWLEQVYHRSAHAGLDGQTPLARYQRDLPRIRCLGQRAVQLDQLFHHRISRFVRKDGTVSYLGRRWEVACELAGRTVALVVDPHAQQVVGVEDQAGQPLGGVAVLDAVANLTRRRRRNAPTGTGADAHAATGQGPNLVEIAHRQYHGLAQPGHGAAPGGASASEPASTERDHPSQEP